MAQPPFFQTFPLDDFSGGNGYDRPPTLPSHRSNYDFNSQIFLTAILSLSFVIVVVVSLHLYARCVLRRQARSRIVIRRLGLLSSGMLSGEAPRSGLDPAVIASLPMFVFKLEEGQDDATSVECAVCLSMLEDQEMARILPNCKHTFHAECIDKWLSSRSTCPICRTEAEPRVQPEPREGPVGGGAPVAPTLENVNSTLVRIEGTSEISGINQSSASPKVGSGSRLSSFRRLLSRERSSRGIQSEIQEDHGVEDLERQ